MLLTLEKVVAALKMNAVQAHNVEDSRLVFSDFFKYDLPDFKEWAKSGKDTDFYFLFRSHGVNTATDLSEIMQKKEDFKSSALVVVKVTKKNGGFLIANVK